MIINYGTYASFCYVDRDNGRLEFYFMQGAAGLPTKPIGDLEEFALVIDNIIKLPNIMDIEDTKIERDAMAYGGWRNTFLSV